MQIEDAVDGAGSVAGVADLGPLAWVLDELRKSLEVANKSLKRYVRDAEAARGTDLASVDASQLRMARQHMHQAVGALEMVGLLAPAHMLRAMEAAVQQFVQRPERCNEASAALLERASFALLEYLDVIMGGVQESAVGLFLNTVMHRCSRALSASIQPTCGRLNGDGFGLMSISTGRFPSPGMVPIAAAWIKPFCGSCRRATPQPRRNCVT